MKSVLLIQTAFIGDVILSTVIVENIHRQYPAARIDFLVRKGNESLFENHPYINKVLSWNKKENKYRHLFKLLYFIRKQRYDLVLNVQRYAATGLLCGLSGAPARIGYSNNPLSFLFSRKVSHQFNLNDQIIHETTRCNNLLESIAPCPVKRPKLYPSTTDYSRIAAYTTSPYLVIAPGSVWFTKQTPVQKWIKILQQLPATIPVYIIGSQKETPLAAKLLEALPHNRNIHSLTGQLTFLQSAALMESALFNLVNDSAPLHFASAMNAPVIAVYCSTTPTFGFTPLSAESHIIQVDQQLTCRPCGTHGKAACPQKHFNCGNLIDETKINKLINEKISAQIKSHPKELEYL